MINEFELAKQIAELGEGVENASSRINNISERVDYVAGRITDLGKTLVAHEQWIRKVARQADHVEMLHNHQAADADDFDKLVERVESLEGHTDWNRSDARDDLNGLAERVEALEDSDANDFNTVEQLREDVRALREILDNDYNSLACQVEAQNASIRAVRGQVNQLSDEVRGLSEGEDEYTTGWEQGNYIERLEAENAELKSHERGDQERAYELQQYVYELENDIVDFEKRINELEEENRRLVVQVQNLNGELAVRDQEKHDEVPGRHPDLITQFGTRFVWVEGYVNDDEEPLDTRESLEGIYGEVREADE